MSPIEKASTALTGAAMARDRSESDMALIYVAVADRALLDAEAEIARLRAQTKAVRDELARQEVRGK